MSEIWTTSGFEAFRRGKFGGGGQNIYVSHKGVLQRIHRSSVRDRGHVDLMFANAQCHEEMVPMDVYPDPVNHPEKKWQIHMAAAAEGVVADFSGNGTEDMAWAFVWDGMCYIHNSAMFYMGENGPSDKYITYLPSPTSTAVAAGDFNGDGRMDIAYGKKDLIRIFLQDELGFITRTWTEIKTENLNSLLGHKFPNDETATLFLRKKDGSVTMLKDFTADAQELPCLPPDPDYEEISFSWDNYNQAVEKNRPKLREVKIDDKTYLTVFRKNCLLLYPFEEAGLGEPLTIPCKEGLVAATADLFGRGETDLVIAARDRHGKKEYSYVFLGKDGFFDTENPLPIVTFMASDVCVGNLSGGKGTDFVISQNHTYDSFDNDVLVFATGKLSEPSVPKPIRLQGHNVYCSLIVHDKLGRSYLVVGNQSSGSYLGNPENTIYLGSDTGYHEHDVIHLPSWGSVAMACADLNDDGRADLVFANAAEISGAVYRERGSYIYYQKANGDFGRQPFRLKTTRAHGVVVGDMNNDGYLDIAFCGFDHSILKVYYGSEEGYKEENAVEIKMEDENGELYKNALFIGMADLNGDGYLDLILPCIDKEKSLVLWGSPDGFSMKNRQEFRIHHASGHKVADLNGDGYPELILAGHSPTSGRPWDSFIHIYWGGPDGFSETRRTQLPCCCVNSMNIADFNNDGLLDIFVGSYEDIYNRDIPSYIYWNSPEGFSPYNRTMIQTHAVSGSYAADFNDDGYIDLAIGNHKYFGAHICKSTVWYNGPNGFDEKNTVNLPTFGVHGMNSVDSGNVLDRSFDEYYESEVHEIPEGCGISEIYWDADIPHKCDVFAQFRTADSLEELETERWCGPTALNDRFRAHDAVEKERFCGKYMQYRLILYAFNSVSSPRVRSVSVKFEPYSFD